MMNKTRRRDGKGGWFKGICHYSNTGWAWWRASSAAYCTCQPCTRPRDESIEAFNIKREKAMSIWRGMIDKDIPELPKRIQRKRTKGWRMPDGAVYVGRPTKYGNRFIVGKIYTEAEALCRDFNYNVSKNMIGKPLTAANCIVLYRDLISSDKFGGGRLVDDWVGELRGKDLACWCPLDQPCHADVLLELVNAHMEDGDLL